MASAGTLLSTQSLKESSGGLHRVISDLASLDLSFLTNWKDGHQHGDPHPEEVSEKEHEDHSGPAAKHDPEKPEASGKAGGAGAPKSTLAKSGSHASAGAREPVTCQVACLSWPGSKDGFKKSNQDAYCFMRTKDKKSLLFGVFDGHGPQGRDASQLVKQRLPELLMEKGDGLLTDTPGAFISSFEAVQEEIMRQKPFEPCVSGTTAVMAHLHLSTLTVAWAGDSRAVLAKRCPAGGVSAVAVSEDHKPEKETERERIEASHGSVYRDVNEVGDDVGPFRVWTKQGPMLRLAMSRSLGDGLAHSVGVSCTPEVKTLELEKDDLFLILASDRVWEFMSNEEAVEIVRSCAKSTEGTKKLMQAAKARWLEKDVGSYVDDITALVIAFTHNEC